MSGHRMSVRILLWLFCAGASLIVSDSFGADISLSVKASTTHSREKEQNTEQKKQNFITTMIEKETGTCTLEIEIENPADHPANCEVLWCVIAKRTVDKDDAKQIVSDAGKIEITRGGKMTGTEIVNPKPFIFTTTSIDRAGNSVGGYNANSTQTREGDVYAGYIVLVKAGGEVVAQESNDDRFLKEEWVAQCEKAVQLKVSQSKAKQKKKK